MYDFLLSTANICKDIFIPIFILLLIVAAINYLGKKSKLYKTLSDTVYSFSELVSKEYDKIPDNAVSKITNFQKKGD